MFLDVINQEIFERSTREDMVVTQPKKKQMKNEGYAQRTLRQRAEKCSVPDSWIESAIRRISLGESDRRELTAELKLRYDLNESQASWILLENEETKAEVIMATRDIVDRITGWLEDIAAMRSEQFLELLDEIKQIAGSDVSQRYSDAVRPALETIYNALEQSRQGLTTGLSIVSGEETETLGAPAPGAPESPDTAIAPGAAPAPGGAPMPGQELQGEPVPDAGRMKRESVEYSRKLGMMLSSKKK
jgi:hypothetical protein